MSHDALAIAQSDVVESFWMFTDTYPDRLHSVGVTRLAPLTSILNFEPMLPR